MASSNKKNGLSLLLTKQRRKLLKGTLIIVRNGEIIYGAERDTSTNTYRRVYIEENGHSYSTMGPEEVVVDDIRSLRLEEGTQLYYLFRGVLASDVTPAFLDGAPPNEIGRIDMSQIETTTSTKGITSRGQVVTHNARDSETFQRIVNRVGASTKIRRVEDEVGGHIANLASVKRVLDEQDSNDNVKRTRTDSNEMAVADPNNERNQSSGSAPPASEAMGSDRPVKPQVGTDQAQQARAKEENRRRTEKDELLRSRRVAKTDEGDAYGEAIVATGGGADMEETKTEEKNSGNLFDVINAVENADTPADEDEGTDEFHDTETYDPETRGFHDTHEPSSLPMKPISEKPDTRTPFVVKDADPKTIKRRRQEAQGSLTATIKRQNDEKAARATELAKREAQRVQRTTGSTELSDGVKMDTEVSERDEKDQLEQAAQAISNTSRLAEDPVNILAANHLSGSTASNEPGMNTNANTAAALDPSTAAVVPPPPEPTLVDTNARGDPAVLSNDKSGADVSVLDDASNGAQRGGVSANEAATTKSTMSKLISSAIAFATGGSGPPDDGGDDEGDDGEGDDNGGGDGSGNDGDTGGNQLPVTSPPKGPQQPRQPDVLPEKQVIENVLNEIREQSKQNQRILEILRRVPQFTQELNQQSETSTNQIMNAQREQTDVIMDEGQRRDEMMAATAEQIGGDIRQGAEQITAAIQSLTEASERQHRAVVSQIGRGVDVLQEPAPDITDDMDIDAFFDARDQPSYEAETYGFKDAQELVYHEFTLNESLDIVLQQQQISRGSLTPTMYHRILDGLQGWWNEFRLTRVHEAVRDSEQIPTGLLRSSTGDIQLGSKPRADMSQTERQMMHFLYWVMRNKMDGMASMTDWRDLFGFAQAAGLKEITKAQLIWLTLGDANPEALDSLMDTVNVSSLPVDGQYLRDFTRDVPDLDTVLPVIQTAILDRLVLGTPVARDPPPSRNVSPSAAQTAVARPYIIRNGKFVPLTAETLPSRTKNAVELSQTPSYVSNIPDPRFSERGGKLVPNVNIVTVRNPNYDPTKPDAKEFISSAAAPGPNDKYIEKAVPDVAGGARDIDAAIERAEADRLAASVPFKLYAPMHAQACDRYLGEKNYARLGLEPAKYFQSFVQQPIDINNTDGQLKWNKFVMTIYGPSLYAFETEKRTTPLYTENEPGAVRLEFMELNELIGELKRYQMKSADRSSRVGDSAVAQEPIEKHLSDFFESRDQSEQEKINDANAVIISLPDDGLDPSGPPPPDAPPDRPGADVKPTSDDANSAWAGFNPVKAPVQFGAKPSYDYKSVIGLGSEKYDIPITIGPRDIDRGIRRDTYATASLTYNRDPLAHTLINDPRNQPMDKKAMLFRALNR